MNLQKLIASISLIFLMFLSNMAFAQMETSVAVLPTQTNRVISKNVRKNIDNALTKAYKNFDGYSVLTPNQSRKKAGKLGDVTSDQTLAQAGERLEVDLVLSCKLQVKRSKKQYRLTFNYTLTNFDVKGSEKLGQVKGTCKDCSAKDLNKSIAKKMTTLLLKPYPLGLDTEPKGAIVYHSGKNWGKTPFRKILPEGNYKIVIQKNGFKSIEVEFPMPSDRPVYATLPLEEDPDYLPPIQSAILAPIPGGAGSKAPAPAKAPEPAPVVAEKTAKPATQNPQQLSPSDVEPMDLPSIGKPMTKKPEPQEELKEEPKPIEPEPIEEPEKIIAEPEPEKTEEPEVETAPVVSRQMEMSVKRKWAWRTLGLSAAFVMSGVGLTVAALHSDDRAGDSKLLKSTRNDYADRRDGYWIGSYTLYGLAAAGITTSLILFFTDDKPHSVSVVPVITNEGAAISAAVRY